MHDELGFDVYDGDFLAPHTRDKPDQRALIHRKRDIGSELTDAVGSVFVQEVEVRCGEHNINLSAGHLHDIPDFQWVHSVSPLAGRDPICIDTLMRYRKVGSVSGDTIR